MVDLLAVLREQGSRRHGEVLEWIGELGFECDDSSGDSANRESVIVLIAAEILVA